MPDDGGFGGFLSDIGGGLSDAASWVGNQLGIGGGSSGGAAPLPSFNFAASGSNAPAAGPVNPAFDPSASFMSGGAAPATTSAISADPFSYGNPTANPSAPSSAGPPATDSIMKSLGLDKVSPIGALASGGGLLANLAMGSPSSSAEKQLKNIAGSQSAQGQQLESYIANGTLPPGAQQWVNQQTAAQSAAIRSKYAQMGLSGSTAETQELNNVQSQATAQMFEIASQLLNTGVTETNASGTLYNYLMQAQNADQKDVSSAIQNFVGSLSGGGGSGGQTFTLKTGS